MIHYTIEQTETKKRNFLGFNLKPVKKTKVYKFNDYKNAFIFALNEQIKKIYCNISKDIKTIRKPFKNYYTLNEFIKVSKKNPFFYLGVRDYKHINIKNYYYYLINANKLNKLKKF